MKTLAAFHKENPVVAEGVRKLNSMPPTTTIDYQTYRDWVQGKRKPMGGNKVLLFLKGVKA